MHFQYQNRLERTSNPSPARRQNADPAIVTGVLLTLAAAGTVGGVLWYRKREADRKKAEEKAAAGDANGGAVSKPGATIGDSPSLVAVAKSSLEAKPVGFVSIDGPVTISGETYDDNVTFSLAEGAVSHVRNPNGSLRAPGTTISDDAMKTLSLVEINLSNGAVDKIIAGVANLDMKNPGDPREFITKTLGPSLSEEDIAGAMKVMGIAAFARMFTESQGK